MTSAIGSFAQEVQSIGPRHIVGLAFRITRMASRAIEPIKRDDVFKALSTLGQPRRVKINAGSAKHDDVVFELGPPEVAVLLAGTVEKPTVYLPKLASFNVRTSALNRGLLSSHSYAGTWHDFRTSMKVKDGIWDCDRHRGLLTCPQFVEASDCNAMDSDATGDAAEQAARSAAAYRW